MNLGRVGIWAGDLDNYPASGVREAVAAIEELGYGTLWIPETIGREAMTQAALALATTSRITVATGIASIYARDAVSAAAGQRTLDEAFPDRFVLGLGVSHPVLVEDIRGHRFGPPVATMRAYLDAMDATNTAGARPRLLAALGPGLLRLAGTRASGAFPLGMPVEHTAYARKLLGPDALLAVAQLVVTAPELAREQAAQALPNRRRWLADLGYQNVDALDDVLVDALVVRGSTDEIADRVHAHLDAGADHVSLHLVTPTPATPPVRHWQEIATRLLT